MLILNDIITFFFNVSNDETRTGETIYEFSSPHIMTKVVDMIRVFSLETETLQADETFVVRIFTSSMVDTKRLIALYCARRLKKYKQEGKSVDFPLLGISWKGDDRMLAGEIKKSTVYEDTYGAESKG